MKEVTFSDIASITNDYKLLGVSISLILIVSALIYCWKRAGSLYFFWDRLWFLIGGRKDFNDKNLNELWEGVRDVELFRYRSGFNRVYSKGAIDKIIEWLSTNKIELSEIIRVQDYFDTKELCLKKYNYVFRERVTICFALFLSLFLCISSVLITENRVLFHVVKTNKFFLYSGEVVSIYNQDLDKNTCKEKYNTTDSLNEILKKDVMLFNKIVACKIYDKEEDFYNEQAKMQKMFFAVVTIVLIFTLIFLIRLSNRLNMAENIYLRLFERSSKENRRFP